MYLDQFQRCMARCFSIVAFFCASPLHAGMMDRVLVIVNEDVVTQAEYDYRKETILSEMKKNGAPATEMPKELSKQLLDALIADRLQLQEAERRGIEISDDELEAAISRFAARQQLDMPQLHQQILSQGQSYERFRDTVRESLILSRLTEFYARSRVVVPDYEIEGYIVNHGMTDAGTEYRISRLLLSDTEANRKLADKIIEEVRDGADFQKYVVQYSEANDAVNGGIIGWLTLDKLPDIYSEAVKGMSQGEITDLLVTANGLQILKLLEIKGDRQEIVQTHVRHILISAESKVAKSQAVKKMNDLRQRIVEGEDFSSLARIYSDDSVSAANGGDLNWVSPGETVPNFEKTYLGLKIDELSQPIETQFGVHLIQVLDRRKKDVTQQVIRGRVENLLRRQRAEREFEQWVRELREEAYIEYVAEPV